MSGLTIEDVNTMQDEMNKIEDPDEIATAEVAKVAGETAKLEEAKTVEDATKAKADAEVAKGKEVEGKSKTEEDESPDALRLLREENRANKDALLKITNDYQKLHKIMVDKGLITDEEVKETKAEEEAAKVAFAERQNKLTEIVTLMELNPLYTDVRQVCTQGNLDDILDAFASYHVKENGGSVAETASKLSAEIWAESNPYKRIYELVKKYHPKYAVAAANTDTEAKKKLDEIAAEADKVKKKEPVDVQSSAANMGTGGSGAGVTGWTAARIDELPESELNTVPRDIYDKYMSGTLK